MHPLITAASGSQSLLVNLAHCFKFYLYISKCSKWKDHKIMMMFIEFRENKINSHRPSVKRMKKNPQFFSNRRYILMMYILGIIHII